jgi:replicative DNA helicase
VLENEEIFLGQILMKNAILDETIIQDHHFLSGKTRRVFAAIKKARETMKSADISTVYQADSSLDPAYIAGLTNLIPTTANWREYERDIVKSFQLSRLNALGKSVVDMTAARRPPEEILSFIDDALVEATTRVSQNKVHSIRECLVPYLTELEKRYNAKGALAGISSGLDDLDDLTNGFRPSMLYVIGARPSQGKSALALNMATFAAMERKVPTGIISLESSKEEITGRAFASVGHIDGDKLLKGILAPADFQRIMETGGRLENAPLFLYDVPNIEIAEVKSIARRMVSLNKVQLIFIDYLQIIGYPDRRIPRAEQVADISTQLKNLARELKIPIVALAQLRRDAEGRRPTMADISDSSQIEKDADGIIFIYHRQEKDEKTGEDFTLTKLLAEKMRDGKTGDIDAVFRREYVKFYPLERKKD